jgi:outer membrane cobalamin receptor
MRIPLTSLMLLSSCLASVGENTFRNTRIIEHGLKETPQILVNSQGWAQHDLSIRGSSYTGAGISVNGLNLKNPYSAHFNTELPFISSLFSAPSTHTGLDNATGHLVGTAAYTTLPRQDRYVQASAGVGSKEQYQATVSAQSMGASGFVDWEKARRIDHHANDLDRVAGGATLQILQDDWTIDLLGGYQRKEFGAQGYYGLPSNIYAKDRIEDSMFLASASIGDLNDAYFRVSGAWRQLDDKYTIPVAGYKSSVRSRFGTAAIEGRTLEVQHIALNFRGDLEYEEVDGDIGDHDRTRGSVLILPQFTYEHFKITAGLNSIFQTSESTKWLPQAKAEWFITDNSTLYTSYSETVQQPDYQTLHYSDPFRSGNRYLDLQEAENSELGFRQYTSDVFDWRAAAFYRRLKNASDWTKTTALDTQWQATDLGTLDTAGIETELTYYPSDTLELKVYYQWITKDDYDFYAGLYETDYPEHLLAFSGQWKPSAEFTLFASQTMRYQADNNAREHSNFGPNASLGLHWFPRFVHSARLSFMVDNLWGTDFQTLPGLKTPKRTVSTGITVAW